MTSDVKKILDEKERLIPKIIDILAYQVVITSQGERYTGEKDWALNKILSLIDEECSTLRDYIARLERESEAGKVCVAGLQAWKMWLSERDTNIDTLDNIITRYRTACEGEEK